MMLQINASWNIDARFYTNCFTCILTYEEI